MTHPYEIRLAQEREEAEALEPVARCAYAAFAATITDRRVDATAWDDLAPPMRDAWRMVAKTLAGSTPAYRRGAGDAIQDSCEGIPANLKVGEVPDYIDKADASEFARGYESIARHHR